MCPLPKETVDYVLECCLRKCQPVILNLQSLHDRQPLTLASRHCPVVTSWSDLFLACDMSIPDLLLHLCNSVSQQLSLQQEHRGTCYRILLGLHEVCRNRVLFSKTSQHQQAWSLLLQVDWDEVEDTDRQHLNAGWIQEVRTSAAMLCHQSGLNNLNTCRHCLA